jgi:hypothetical protein
MSTMNPEFVDAVCKLVEAVIYQDCTIAGSEDGEAVIVTVDAALAVAEAIRAAPEFSALHGWADCQLAVHAGAGLIEFADDPA